LPGLIEEPPISKDVGGFLLSGAHRPIIQSASALITFSLNGGCVKNEAHGRFPAGFAEQLLRKGTHTKAPRHREKNCGIVLLNRESNRGFFISRKKRKF